MMFPFAQPTKPPVPDSPPVESDELKSRKNTSDRLFQAICGSIGGVAAHSARSSPQYFPLLVLASSFAIAFLSLVPPRDKDFLGLYRSGALVLLCGLVIPFWELLLLIPQQLLVGIAIALPIMAIALIAFLGRS